MVMCCLYLFINMNTISINKIEDNEEDDWFYEGGTSIQCCLCGKWRFLGEISENEITSLEYWDCSMNADTRLVFIILF